MLNPAHSKRFANVSERIFRKVEATFGRSIEDAIEHGPHRSMFYGEEEYRELEIVTSELTFRVRVAVARA